MQVVPLKSAQLQFHQAKDNLDQILKDVEIEVADEHQALKDGKPCQDVMSKHQVSGLHFGTIFCILMVKPVR